MSVTSNEDSANKDKYELDVGCYGVFYADFAKACDARINVKNHSPPNAGYDYFGIRVYLAPTKDGEFKIKSYDLNLPKSTLINVITDMVMDSSYKRAAGYLK